MENIKFQIIDDSSYLFPEESSNSTPPPIPPPSIIKQSEFQVIHSSNSVPVEFSQKMSTEKMEKPLKLCILTPCFAGQCTTNYVICLMNTMELFRNMGILLRIEFCKNDSLVSRARNNLVAKAMSDPEVTHIMFIDNDITWNPNDILKLIQSNKEIVGGIYPLKSYDWSKMSNPHFIKDNIERKEKSALKDKLSNEKMVKYNLLKYNVNYLDPMLHVEHNLAKVKHIATGFMMIQRSCIEKMMERYFYTKYTDDVSFLDPHENKMAYALFDCGVCDDHYYSEDWMFCDRWSKMGGSIWIDISINLTHSGPEDFEGSYISSII